MSSAPRRSTFVSAALFALAQLLAYGAGSPAAAADGSTMVYVCLKDSGGNPIVPDTTSYQINGGSILAFDTTIDSATNCKYDAVHFPAGTTNVTIWTTYNHTTSAHITQNVSTNPRFDFQTDEVTVRVQNASETGVAGVSVRYGGPTGSSYWYLGTPTGTTGELNAQLFAGTQTFRVDVNSTSTFKTQDVGIDPLVVFNTTALTLGYSGTVAFGGPTGDSAYFTPAHTREFFPGTVNFRFDFSPGGPIRLPITIADTPLGKSMIVARLLDGSSNPISGVAVSAEPGAISLGTTDTNGIAYALADGSLGDETVSFTYGGKTFSLTQNQASNSIYRFIVTTPVDGTPPDLALSGGASGFVNSQAHSVTATFSEPVNGFGLGDVALTNASASNLAGTAGGSIYTFDVTATADGPVTVRVPAAAADDLAGNASTASNTLAWTYDGTAPKVEVTGVADGASYPPGSVPTAGCSTSDALAGVATAATLSTNGGPLGSVTVTCSGARDNAGNGGGASATYSVVYDWTGFFSPVDNLPVLNVAKAGSAIPVKFSLNGDEGLAIFATNYPASVPVACNSGAATDAIESTVSAGGSSLTYDATTSQYTYVWKTTKTWTGCRQLVLTLADGTRHVANFSFR
jgi:hypothetical protein